MLLTRLDQEVPMLVEAYRLPSTYRLAVLPDTVQAMCTQVPPAIALVPSLGDLQT